MKSHRRVLVLVAATLSCFGVLHPHCDAGELSLKTLRVALKPDKNPDRMVEEKSRFEQYLSARLGSPVEVIVPLSSSVITEGFANGTIDLGYLSSTGAARAREQGVAEVLLAGEIDGHSFYLSYWIALKGKPYQRVEDLRGKPIAFSSRTSTSGFIFPVWDLYTRGYLSPKDGPEAYFGKGNVSYGVGYVSAVEQVLNGKVEAAAVSYYVLDEDRHLTLEQRRRLKMVASQGPVPTHTISVRTSLPMGDREMLKKILVSMNEDNPNLRDAVFSSKLIEVDPETHLKSTNEALELISRMNF